MPVFNGNREVDVGGCRYRGRVTQDRQKGVTVYPVQMRNTSYIFSFRGSIKETTIYTWPNRTIRIFRSVPAS